MKPRERWALQLLPWGRIDTFLYSGISYWPKTGWGNLEWYNDWQL